MEKCNRYFHTVVDEGLYVYANVRLNNSNTGRYENEWTLIERDNRGCNKI